MKNSSASESEMKGGLILARPKLIDPNFRRTVVYLARHSAKGTLGFVLNRPSGKCVREIVAGNKELLPIADLPVYIGGPVAQDQLIIALFEWSNKARCLVMRHNLTVESALKGHTRRGAVLRAFVGHSGWGAGQLEREMQQRSWFVKPSQRELLDREFCDDSWRRIISTMGPMYRLAAQMPDDPSLN